MKQMEKFAKKLFAIVTALAIVLIPLAKVSAAAQTISIGSTTKTEAFIGDLRTPIKKTTDGKYLFCVNSKGATTVNIEADLLTTNVNLDGGVAYILRNSFPAKSITGDVAKDYYITQMAIWWYQDETSKISTIATDFKSKWDDKYNLRPTIKNLVEEAKNHMNDPVDASNTELSLSTTNATMTLQGNYYVSSAISAKTNVSEYTVTLEGAPTGTIIEVNGENVTSLTAKISGTQSFKIKVPATVAQDNLSIKVKGTATGAYDYRVLEYKPHNTSMQNVAMIEKVQRTATSDVTVKISLATKVSINKVDADTEQPIAGAVLVLRDANGNELTRWTSTTQAHIIENLPYGTYTIEEESAPRGYTIDKKETKFTLSETKKDVKVTIKNTAKTVVVNITKVDQATGEALAGAVLVIKDANGEVVYKFTTGATSEVITDLENGTYTIEEESAPEGYIKSDEIITFTIDDEHLSHQIIFENAKEYYVPDTGSASSVALIILGIVITGLGLKFVYKNGQNTR